MPNDLILAVALKNYSGCLASEFAEDFLQILLHLMSVVFILDADFRKNIKGFEGRYQFRSQDGCIIVAALFRENCLVVREREILHPDITILFKDGRALMDFLLTPKPDLLGSMQRQEVTLDGNLNYLYKFAFMARRLQLQATGAR